MKFVAKIRSKKDRFVSWCKESNEIFREREEKLVNIRKEEPNIGKKFLNFSMKSNVAALVICIALFAAIVPYAYVSDCRANFNTIHALNFLRLIFLIFLFGFAVCAFPSVVVVKSTLIRDWLALRGRDVEAERATKAIMRVNQERFLWAMFGLAGFLLFTIGAAVSMVSTYGEFNEQRLVEWQSEATRWCVKAQITDLKEGSVNPWLQVNPAEPQAK